MTAIELKEKLHHYIYTAQNKKLKAIYTMVEDDIDEGYDRWKDDDFVNELLRREKSLETVDVKGYTIEVAVAKVKSKLDSIN